SEEFIIFFFVFSSRRRHTRFSRDWSSDVCSSDLNTDTDAEINIVKNFCVENNVGFAVNNAFAEGGEGAVELAHEVLKALENPSEIGRASCRESVDLGGRGSINRKRTE